IVSPAKHHHTSSSIRSPTLRLTKTQLLEPKISNKLQNVCRIGVSGEMHAVIFWKLFRPRDTSQLITRQDGCCNCNFLCTLPNPDSHVIIATGFDCDTIFWYMRHIPAMGFLSDFTVTGTINEYMVSMLCGSESCAMMTGQYWNIDMMDAAGFVTFAFVNISTSAQLTNAMPLDFTPPNIADPTSSISYFRYFDGSYLAVTASLNGGNVVAILVAMLSGWMNELGTLIYKHSHTVTDLVTNPNLSDHLDSSDLRVSLTIRGERHDPLSLAVCRRVFSLPVEYGQDVDSAVGVIMVFHGRL
uniref:Uncharacterized protein n=1 Tax=Oncorhynchus mykiss TaxID=8022 RepID=A0A8K9XMY4_ONCMY